ncbi:hypothetical protein FNV43_RR23267 [Rhamnella rubrinervis]|uniref:Uncharacterized protein n=1 Tax=Rhamnella rubrinervis TaxID=2594499 RepID=A0A8K0DRZ6_9ROSA|nr:hypothetical protein FNV43_RR23267 [Rhamnella rubrinervis]
MSRKRKEKKREVVMELSPNRGGAFSFRAVEMENGEYNEQLQEPELPEGDVRKQRGEETGHGLGLFWVKMGRARRV